MTVYDIIERLEVINGWSPLLGNCIINLDDEKIWIRNESGNGMILDKDGKFNKEGECLIFQSKDDKDWTKFYKEISFQLLPFNTLVMVSNNGEAWDLRYYKIDRQCSINKSYKEGLSRKYMVLPSKFDFEADDLSINIKNSI